MDTTPGTRKTGSTLINFTQPIAAELRANRVRVDADFSATPFKAKISNDERCSVEPVARKFGAQRRRYILRVIGGLGELSSP